jgi:hypothetical protein
VDRAYVFASNYLRSTAIIWSSGLFCSNKDVWTEACFMSVIGSSERMFGHNDVAQEPDDYWQDRSESEMTGKTVEFHFFGVLQILINRDLTLVSFRLTAGS